jgi:hypothetical protein
MKSTELKEVLAEIAQKLEKYNIELTKHMARSDTLEEQTKALKEYFEYRQDAVDIRMDRHEAAFNSLPTKALQYVSIMGGIVGLIKQLF